jgi:hypothetical protein
MDYQKVKKYLPAWIPQKLDLDNNRRNRYLFFGSTLALASFGLYSLA